MKTLSLVCFVTVMVWGDLAAQAAPVVGDPVRITAAGRRFTARFLSWTSDSLTVVEGSGPQTLPRTAITELDRQVGTKSAVLQSLGVGALVGGLSGAALGAAFGGDCTGQFLCYDRGTMALVLGVTGGVVGLVGGAIRGALRHIPVWQSVPLGTGQASIRFVPVVSPAGFGLRGTLSFR